MEQNKLIAIIVVVALVAVAAIGAVFLLKGDSGGETTYTVKYDTNGGNAIDDKEFTKNTDTFDLATPTKDGNTFLGWYLNADFSGDKITQIAKGTEKNITVYAKWQLDLANNTVPSAAQVAANTDVKVTFDSGAGDKTIDNAILDELKAGKTLTVEDTVNKISWTFIGAASKDAEYTAASLDTAVTVTETPTSLNPQATLSFSHSGQLPYASTVKYFFGTDFVGQSVTVKNSSTSEVLGPFTVDSQGYVEFEIDHCSDWTITVVYTVTFDADGGLVDGSATKTISVAFNGKVGTLPEATKTGNSFVSWGSPAITSETVVTGNVTYTAVWSVNQYTISFDTGEGSDVSPITQDYGTAVTAPGNPIRTGYTFSGWDKELPATMPAENLTLTAVWTVNKYTATVNLAGGTVANVPAGWNQTDSNYTKDFDYGTAKSDIITDFGSATRTGYEFGSIDSASATMGTEGMALTATWAPHTYKVRFNANGGNGTMIDQDFTYGVEQALTANGFTSDTAAFNGWATSADGTVAYGKGASVSNLTAENGGIVNLYAVWGNFNISVYVKLDGKDRTNVSVQAKLADETPLNLAYSDSLKAYYTDSGVKASGDYAIYIDGKDTGIIAGVAGGSGNATVEYFTVTFDPNEGTGTPIQQVVLKDAKLSDPEADFERTGYSIFGYKYRNDGWTMWSWENPVTETIALYAHWQAKNYVVMFDKAEGAGGADSMTATYDADLPSIAVPAKDGHDFQGYFLNEVQYYNENGQGLKKWDIDGTVTLTAKWAPKSYTVTLNLGEGTMSALDNWICVGSEWTKQFQFGTSYQTILGEVTKTPAGATGYRFTEWARSADTVTTEGLTFTAGYEIIQYKVVFDVDGGSYAIDPVLGKTIGSTVTKPVYDGVKYGYMPSGTWKFSDGTNPFDGNSFTLTEEIIGLYAQGNDTDGYTLTLKYQWDVIYAKVAFDLNTGTGTAPEQLTQVKYKDEIRLPSPKASKEGKVFGGWNTAADGSGTTYKGYVTVDEAMFDSMVITTITLYAEWVDGLYTAAVGDTFTGHAYSYSRNGSVIEESAFKAVVVRQDAVSYDLETMLQVESLWISFGYATFPQGLYPTIFSNSEFEEMCTMAIENDDSPVADTARITINGVETTLNLTIYSYSLNIMTFRVALDDDGTCIWYEVENGDPIEDVGEYGRERNAIESLAIGPGSGYVPAQYQVVYHYDKEEESATVTRTSQNYILPEDLGFEAPAGTVFAGWDALGYDTSELLFDDSHIILNARDVYAVWEKEVVPITNIDWTIYNLPKGITFTIDGEDAFAKDGSSGKYLTVEGGSDWSCSDDIYSVTVDGVIYKVQRKNYNDDGVDDSPDGNRMRFQFGELPAYGYYTIQIHFWMDSPLDKGYNPTVGDSFTYSIDIGKEYDWSYTVTQVNNNSYNGNATCQDYTSGLNIQKYYYPGDSTHLVYSSLDFSEHKYAYTEDIFEFGTDEVDCYKVQMKVYRQGVDQDDRGNPVGVRTNAVEARAYYGIADSLLYCFYQNFGGQGSTSTATLTSKTVAKDPLSKYTVVLDANGGSFSSGTTKTKDPAFTVSITNPIRADMELAGWNTEADGTGKTYVSGQIIDPSDVSEGKLTLYAQWSFAGVIVIASNEDAEPSSQQVLQTGYEQVMYYPMQFREMNIDGKAPAYFSVYGTQYTMVSVMLSNYTITSTGNGKYTFNGAAGDLICLEKGAYIYEDEMLRTYSITIYCDEGATVHLDLVYSSNVVNVTYHSNYGEDTTITAANSSEGYYVFLPADTFERSGYTFLGWSKTSDGSVLLDASAEFMEDWGAASFDKGNAIEFTDLYAVWEVN